jgi:hypothetical protein
VRLTARRRPDELSFLIDIDVQLARLAMSCHGTSWVCSIAENTISSPGFRNLRPHALATRLIDSVVLRVKITSCDGCVALMKRPVFSRAASYASVASSASVCSPRWMFAL